MKILYLIRHAKSSWEFDKSDHERPLNNRGLEDADLIGKELKILLKPIDKVLCSSAERAQQTADIIIKHLEVSTDMFTTKSKLYDFDGNQVLEVIKECSDEIKTLMIFGHNHALTSIANTYGDVSIDNVPTAGVVGIEFNVNNWKSISVGKTLLTLFPKDLK